MRKKETRDRSNQAGFTLIELMVVIVIIGILAAIVVPRMVGASDEAKVTAARAQISSFRTALDMYRLQIGSYPSTSEGLEALISNETGRNFLDQDAIPLDPWNNPYEYTSPGPQGHDYEIVSRGANRSPGGTGYDADIYSWDLQGRLSN